MTDIAFRAAWGKSDAGLISDTKAFWHSMGVVMTPEEMEQRAGELCALAYADGKVVAVSTAAPYDFPRLRARFFYYRTVIAPEFRRQKLAAQLCAYSRDLLAAWARENPQMKIKGLYMVFQAEEFRKHPFVPVEKRFGVDFVLIGYTPSGDRVRVVWFDDAIV